MKIRKEVGQLIALRNIYCADSQEVLWLLKPDGIHLEMTGNYGNLLGLKDFAGTMSLDQLMDGIQRTDRRRVKKLLEQLISGKNLKTAVSFGMNNTQTQYLVEMTAESMFDQDDRNFVGMMRFNTVNGGCGPMKVMNYQDPLTGVYNRSYFNYQTASRTASLGAEGKCAVIYMDMDNFKDINDQYGHHFGDDVIIAFFKRLTETLQGSTLIARPGGDEALVLIDGLGETDELNEQMDALYRVMKEPVQIEDRSIHLGVSSGIAICPDHGKNLDQLMIAVDAALRMAKESGKSRYCYYDSNYHDELSKRLEIYTHLNRAIEKEELFLVYQPLFDIKKQEVYGAEVLLRWNSHHYGLVPPAMFIPLAEESDLILAIGEWVLINSLKQLNRWQDAINPDFVLSINISPVQIREAGFVDRIKSLLNESMVPMSCVQLELTESVFVADYGNVKRKLEELRELGIRIALDDFGTGYSSLNHIRNLSLDVIKIDRSFISDITGSDQDRFIAGTIVSLAEVLNLKVVAEGIETEEQYEILKQIHCHSAQGYLFGRPMLPDVFWEKHLQMHKKSEG